LVKKMANGNKQAELAQSWWVGFVPPELFRYKRYPKGGPYVAFSFSLFVLVASTVTLAYVAYIGSKTYATESKIETTDMSDDSWDCNMVRQNLDYTL
jgi:hypothetical protein